MAEKDRFLQSLHLDWDAVSGSGCLPQTSAHGNGQVSSEERQAHREALIAASPRLANSIDTEAFFKVRRARARDDVLR